MPPVPQIPTEPVQEGGRWRHHKPASEEVALWFKTVPLDEGMDHADFLNGVVVIPASEKVKRLRADGRGTEETYEQTFTPYVRVDTRVTYFRKLAQKLDLIAVIEPIKVPKSEKPAFENTHMPDGFWWHVAGANDGAQRFLCCTMRVALYEREAWFGAEDRSKLAPTREGQATKQVTGSPDINGLAKAETGAIGRALGVAGILVVGTGIATAEDMADLRENPQQVGAEVLPEAGAIEESGEQVNARLMALQARLKPHEQEWASFTAWWKERSEAGGWAKLDDAPVEVRRGMASKMEGLIAEAQARPAVMPLDNAPQDSSPAEVPGEDDAR